MHSTTALGAGVLAFEDQTLSAWAPGLDRWAAWLIVAWLWFMAAFSYLVGDAQIRVARRQMKSDL